MENLNKLLQNRTIAIWLFTCCFFIFAMVVIGGVTRLTHSGLSITEWKPISGIIPPFSINAWQDEFSSYQKSPEYLKMNLGMSLEEFKGIFWLEFIHRLVGRATGFVFFIPLIYFFIRKKITSKLAFKLIGIFALGAAQGIIGWYMVKSGLKDAPHVSQYWLAFHLCMAFLIYGLVFWTGLSVTRGSWIVDRNNNSQFTAHGSLITFSRIILFLVFLQVMFGAFVAGTHAGLIYNTFPDMDGQFIPGGLFIISPLYKNFFENVATIQFIHRIIAYTITAFVIAFWTISCKFELTTTVRCTIRALLAIVAIQVSLGIFTLLGQVPIILASLHQVFALVLFTIVIFITHELKGGLRVQNS